MTSKKQDKPGDEQSFEESIGELEALIQRIESGDVGLEDSIKAYERGVDLIKRCRGVLGVAEQRVEELSQKLLADDGAEEGA